MKTLKPSQTGAALITVLVSLMIISLMLFEFQYNSMVERKLAYNELNQLQASLLAKSGIRLGLLRVVLFGKAKNSSQLKALTQGAGLGPYLDLIWNLPLPPFPPEASAAKEMLKDDRDATEKILKQTKIKEGKFTHVISSESSRINLNGLVVPADLAGQRIDIPTARPPGAFQAPAKMLLDLLENFMRESEDPAEEFGNLRPDELIFDIMDWVSPGNTRILGGNKDAFYEQQRPPYRAKKGRFNSVEELRLVRGMNENLFRKLKPHITVYSYDSRINLNFASNAVLKAIYRDFSEEDLKQIQEQKNKSGGWPSEAAFVDFVTTTLGRDRFKQAYPDPANYPFTVGTFSFVIESLGFIPKSKSQVQRKITTAVTLAPDKGGTIAKGVTDPNACRAAGKFWHIENQVCINPPTNAAECIGQWDGKCCIYIRVGQACPPPRKPNAPPPDPTNLRVVYWAES